MTSGRNLTYLTYTELLIRYFSLLEQQAQQTSRCLRKTGKLGVTYDVVYIIFKITLRLPFSSCIKIFRYYLLYLYLFYRMNKW